MRFQDRTFDAFAILILFLGLVFAVGPLWLTVTTASHSANYLVRNQASLTMGSELGANLHTAWDSVQLGRKLFNSLIVSLCVTAAKLLLASLAAFGIVFFRSPIRTLGFAAIFVTLMLPLEVRIGPTYALAADVLIPLHIVAGLFGNEFPQHWTILDTYLGLSLPLVASATGVFLFRQVYLTFPPQLVEAARIDGAGPLRFFVDILLPLSKSNFAALAAVTFISTWNQYLWPLLITTRPDMQTAVLALAQLLPDPQDPAPAWNLTLAGLLIVISPPLVVAALCQRWFVRGITASVGEQ